MKKRRTANPKKSNQFLLNLALFVVIVSGLVVIMAGMTRKSRSVLGKGSEKTDILDGVEKSLRGSDVINSQNYLDLLDRDISGL